MGRTARRYRRSAVMAGMLVVVSAIGSCIPGSRVEPARIITTAEREHEAVGQRPRLLGGREGGAQPETVRVNRTPPLKGDIESLDDTSLVRYLNSLTWDLAQANTEIEDAECVHANANDAPCVPPESARVLIQPEIGSFMLSWTAIQQLPHGVIVARVVNYDTADRKERVFGFPAGTKVWWVVDNDPARPGKLRSRYFRRTYSTSAPFVAQVGITRDFIYCDHQHKQGHGKAIAKYVTCSQSLTMDTPGSVRSGDALVSPPREGAGVFRAASFNSVPVPRQPLAMALSGTWITCSAGCCATSP